MAKTKKSKNHRSVKPSAVERSRRGLTPTQNTTIVSSACRSKLVDRFYEPLVLLRVFGQVREERTPMEQFLGTDKCVRRRFLRNLCYVCDHEKGGDATTAIALSECPELYTFWVAANCNASAKAIPFVKDVMRLLGTLLRNESGITPDTFVERCVQFAGGRIKDEIRFVMLAINQCSKFLSPSSKKG